MRPDYSNNSLTLWITVYQTLPHTQTQTMCACAAQTWHIHKSVDTLSMLHLNYGHADAILQLNILVVNPGIIKSHKHPASLHFARK